MATELLWAARGRLLTKALTHPALYVEGHSDPEVQRTCPFQVGHSVVECRLIPVGIFDQERHPDGVQFKELAPFREYESDR